MGITDRALGYAVLVVIAVTLSACAFVDVFSDRALTYNLEAERAQNTTLLLNAVRASLRRPMEFSVAQTVQGTASARGIVALEVPFGPGRGATLSLSGEGSAGTAQFTVAFLDTQEFYAGITAPVQQSFINLLMKQGYPRPVVFSLLVKSIEIDLENNTRITVRNYVGDDFQFETFQGALDYLIQYGITTEAVSDDTYMGPTLTREEAVKDTVSAAKEGLEFKPIGRNLFQ
jgi:hypothetical protein